MTTQSYDIIPRRHRSSVTLLMVSLTVGGGAHAQPAADSDWPCAQHLVPDVSAAVIWPGPLPGISNLAWRDFASIAELVDRLTLRRLSSTEAQNIVADFAESLTPDRKQQQLTLLFTGILEVLNARRSSYIDTIRRFTRHQDTLATQVQQLLNELTELEGKQGEDIDRQHRQVEETVRWHQRVFDQRENSIPALCDQPVEVEQILGKLTRDIANYLD